MTSQIKRVAVIGGAGFIGSHLVDALIDRRYHVRIVDNLDPQVHSDGMPPSYMNPSAEFIRQDIRDRDGLQDALDGVEAIFHLAGAVGVGDSMYRIRHYAETNVTGAANILDILANRKHSVRKIILASSVTVFGEGKYSCPRHGVAFPSLRVTGKAADRSWDMHCAQRTDSGVCGKLLSPLPTDEEKTPAPQSIYAITKRAQEELFLAFGRAYGIPVTVLRYFNVYGSRQALSNPYTGVAKIFALHFAQGKVPVIYEDGQQTRDFVHVSDVARANLLALTRDEADGEIFNVGTGRPTSILEMARAVSEIYGNSAVPEPSNRFRMGDVRHCWSDSIKIRSKLGFEPRNIFPSGLEDVVAVEEAVRGPVQSHVDHEDLVHRGLVT